MTLAELQREFGLKDDVVRFCNHAHLTDLSSIQAHEAAHLGFLSLPGCELSFEDALVNMLTVIRMRDELELNIVTPIKQGAIAASPDSTAGVSPTHQTASQEPIGGDPSIIQLYSNGMISARAYNVCKTADLLRVSLIRKFAIQHGGFSKLRNCGKKTAIELTDLLVKHGAEAQPKRTEGGPHGYNSSELSTQKVFAAHFLKLSTRGRNQLIKHAGSTEPEEIIRFLSEQGVGMPRLSGCGSMTMLELQEMRSCLFDDLANGVKYHRDREATMSPQQLWMERHRVSPDLFKVLFLPKGRLGLLAFLDKYLRQTIRMRNAVVFEALLKEADGCTSRVEFAKRLGLTPERVRQSAVQLERELSRILLCVADLPGCRDHYSELVTSESWFILRQSVMVDLNVKEGTNWSALLFCHLVEQLNVGKFVVVKWSKLFRALNQRRNNDRSIVLLVEQHLVGYLIKATHHLEELLSEKRKEVVRQPLISLEGVIESGQAAVMQDLLERIIIHCLPQVRLEGNALILAPNVEEGRGDKLERVLSVLNEPSHITVVHSTWNRLFSDDPITEDGIRSLVVRGKERFFSIGRSSTYGLRSWERERQDLKGGSIRNIVIECLTHSKVPMHLEDLAETIRYFRPETNVKSVRQNLKLDSSGRFVFFPGGFVGLAGTQYPNVPTILAQVPGSLMRTSVLRKFIGRQRNDLVAYIKRCCEAPEHRIEHVLVKAQQTGRLQLNENGRIMGVQN
ncbi:MAG: hypothetical protein IPM12_02705 [Flavobacteriales bacterium]|nr:hypothetical protein [Flavobacteriales bacterium]